VKAKAERRNYMLAYNHRDVLKQAERLDPDEQLLLLEELAAMIRRRGTVQRKKHSILELRGLGKEIWQDIDVDKYLEEERNSWDG
jgi:hypothetical protein